MSPSSRAAARKKGSLEGAARATGSVSGLLLSPGPALEGLGRTRPKCAVAGRSEGPPASVPSRRLEGWQVQGQSAEGALRLGRLEGGGPRLRPKGNVPWPLFRAAFRPAGVTGFGRGHVPSLLPQLFPSRVSVQVGAPTKPPTSSLGLSLLQSGQGLPAAGPRQGPTKSGCSPAASGPTHPAHITSGKRGKCLPREGGEGRMWQLHP